MTLFATQENQVNENEKNRIFLFPYSHISASMDLYTFLIPKLFVQYSFFKVQNRATIELTNNKGKAEKLE